MDLWIRSQDREKLVLTKEFETQHTNYDGGCQIFAVWQNNYQMVGKYKSKERALEVLDEIQKLINNDGYIDEEEYNKSSGCYHQKNIKVYEMPSE